MFCKIFHQLKHIFLLQWLFSVFLEKEVLLHGTILDIAHQCNKFTKIQNISSLV